MFGLIHVSLHLLDKFARVGLAVHLPANLEMLCNVTYNIDNAMHVCAMCSAAHVILMYAASKATGRGNVVSDHLTDANPAPYYYDKCSLTLFGGVTRHRLIANGCAASSKLKACFRRCCFESSWSCCSRFERGMA